MSAKQILSLLLMCALPFISQAQLSGETQDESLLASAQIVELDAKQQPEALNNWGPPTEKQLQDMTANGWLPLQEDVVQDAVVCAWGDSQGGALYCPAGSTGCRVVSQNNNGVTTYSLQCVMGTVPTTNGGDLPRN